VIAYSTMSQIGYMIMGVSVGAYAAGLFHLMTHAFFKALLFMAAGSLISAMGGEQSLDRMSGLAPRDAVHLRCFVIGGLALTGVPPFSGFFSKDASCCSPPVAAAGTGRCMSPATSARSSPGSTPSG
jgi:NADH-quinone oxidoreductase subunit L